MNFGSLSAHLSADYYSIISFNECATFSYNAPYIELWNMLKVKETIQKYEIKFAQTFKIC